MTSRLLATAALLLSFGCHPIRPVLDAGPKPDVGGSISGTVTASNGAIALGARRVAAINVDTGARFDVSPTPAGGYTVRVPAGMSRLEVQRRSGETLATQPEATEVDAGDLDAGRNFVVAVR